MDSTATFMKLKRSFSGAVWKALFEYLNGFVRQYGDSIVIWKSKKR